MVEAIAVQGTKLVQEATPIACSETDHNPLAAYPASRSEDEGASEHDTSSLMVAGAASFDVDVEMPKVTNDAHDQCCPPSKRRILMVLGFTMELICYADRTNISLAIVPMSKQYGYDESTQGLIFASFFAGYCCTQILGGWAAKQIGGKVVLGWGVFLWTLCTILTPPAASVGIGTLLFCRVCMGFAEGVSLPSMHQITATWIPVHERSRFLTACTSGQFCGTVSAMACSPLVAEWWPGIFYLFGALGLLWNVAWYLLASSTPQQHSTISKAEFEYIKRNITQSEGEDARPTPWLSFLHTAFLANVVAHWAHNWGWYLLLSWLPKFLVSEYGVKLSSSGLLLLPVYVVPFLASNASGFWSDRLLSHNRWQLRSIRVLMQCVAFIGPFLCLVTISEIPRGSAVFPIVFMAGALGFGAFSHSGYWSNIIDIGPNYAGALCGISNTIANFPGVLANLTTGYILEQTGNWAIVFAITCVFYVVGLLVFVKFCEGRVVFE